jgi:hypothetical protein
MASTAEMLAAMAQMDPATVPLAVNPSGAPPNFVDPPSLAGTVFAVGLAFSLISAFFVSLRLYTNWKNARQLGLADCRSPTTRCLIVTDCSFQICVPLP